MIARLKSNKDEEHFDSEDEKVAFIMAVFNPEAGIVVFAFYLLFINFKIISVITFLLTTLSALCLYLYGIASHESIFFALILSFIISCIYIFIRWMIADHWFD